MKIAVAADHAGFEAKEKVRHHLESQGYEIVDCGTNGPDPVDYPTYAAAAAKKVSRGECEHGVMLCGTGIGMAIAANKFKGVRAAVCYDTFSTEMARRHNDANVLCLGARSLDLKKIVELVDLYLKTPFEGGRHQRRVDEIRSLEK
jgi:ribose 5-phosphate isomerase B